MITLDGPASSTDPAVQEALTTSTGVATPKPIEAVLAKFSQFETKYPTANGTIHIPVYVLIPKILLAQPVAAKAKNREPQKHPVFVRFHGGGLMTGTAMLGEWLSPWNFLWALKHGGVVVLPDYRLLPEANGADILQDIDAFWDWVAKDLQSYISATIPKETPIGIDLDRTISMGESAGGYCAIQSGFLHSKLKTEHGINIRGVLAPFPMVDLDDPWFSVPGYASERKFVGLPTMPISIIEDHLDSIRRQILDSPDGKTKPVVTSGVPPERLDLMIAVFQHGALDQFLLGELDAVPEDCYPVRRIQKVEWYPPLFIMHGLQDGAVSDEGSSTFVAKLKEGIKGVEVRLELHNGDHGFDKEFDHEEKEGWFGDAMRWFDKKTGLSR